MWLPSSLGILDRESRELIPLVYESLRPRRSLLERPLVKGGAQVHDRLVPFFQPSLLRIVLRVVRRHHVGVRPVWVRSAGRGVFVIFGQTINTKPTIQIPRVGSAAKSQKP